MKVCERTKMGRRLTSASRRITLAAQVLLWPSTTTVPPPTAELSSLEWECSSSAGAEASAMSPEPEEVTAGAGRVVLEISRWVC